MNYFYGINNETFKSQLQIPTFQNKFFKPSNYQLFKCYPENNIWKIKEIKNKKINKYFYILNNEDINNNDIFFLASDKTIDNFNNKKLEKFNNFTDTDPAYRANLQINLKNGGFSSYQSEYPYEMMIKKGNILTPIYSLANINSERNFIFIKNIIVNPILEKFEAYLVNYKTKKIEEKFELKTNYTNCIELNNNLIKPEIFLVTKKYIGVPMFASINNNYISFEHSQPPFEYVLDKLNYPNVFNLKKEFNDIIN